MFIKILLLSIVTGAVTLNAPITIDKTIKYDDVVTTESIKHRNYQHSEWIAGNTEVVYKYETNEVNSISDLVVGNIYHINITDVSSLPAGAFLRASFCRGFRDDQKVILDVTSYDNYYFSLSKYTDSLCYCAVYDDTETYVTTYYLTYEFDFVYAPTTTGVLERSISYIESSQYNEIISVTYHQPTTIIGYLNEFLETNLLNEIPYIRDINFNIGGQNINLMTWVIMAFGFILIGLLFYFLIRLIIWLVKLFSNSFLLR